MSTSSVIWKAVKAHVPLIKFRKGSLRVTQVGSLSGEGTSSTSPSSSVGLTARGSGMDEEFLPKRYHRKPLSSLEMEVIQRGGPDHL